MRSRLAILGMLALGMVLSTGGAGLAISGLANPKGDAAQTQYGPSVKPEEDTIGEDDVRGEEDEGGPASRVQPREVQPERQVELGVQDSGDEQLPFTGFAAIPILIGGVALLSTGIVLRRRSGEDS